MITFSLGNIKDKHKNKLLMYVEAIMGLFLIII